MFTQKLKDGEHITKARLVAKGYEEKTSHSVRKDSPTCLKENLRILFVVAATLGWKVKSLDVRSAFLQGKEIERDVFLKPPEEADTLKLWKLKKALYGLNDASRQWYLEVRKSLMNLGVKACVCDEAFFYWHCDGKLCGLMAVHVDDFVNAGNDDFSDGVVGELKRKYESKSEEENVFKYLGLQIDQDQELECITMQQKYYIESLKCIKTRNVGKHENLSQQEFTNLRSTLGQLAWVSNQTRPDIAFQVCQVSVNIKNATIEDVCV